MRHHIYTLCALLLLAAPALAAERLDEKVYDAGQQPPAASSSTPGSPTSPNTPVMPDVRIVPGQPSQPSQPSQQGQPSQQDQALPGMAPGDTIIVVPNQSTPGQSIPDQKMPDTPNKDTPSKDALPKNAPTIVVPLAPPSPPILTIPTVPTLPEIPKTPDAEKRDIIVTPVQPVQPSVQPVRPGEKRDSVAPKSEERVILTPADFLPLTPNERKALDSPKDKAAPEKNKGEVTPDIPKDSKPPKTSKEPKEPKDKKEPKKDKSAPEKKKPQPPKPPKKGDILRIPPDAAKTGDLSFLEGCWKGLVSGADGTLQHDDMASRVCFDDKGNGKHSLYDPGKKETCVGPAKGTVSGDSLLRVDYDKVQCPSGKTWYPKGDKYMTCRDGGTGADCAAYFDGAPLLKFRFYKD